jgi:hypothetical protein
LSTTPNNAWGDEEQSDEILINHWQEKQTPCAQTHVPDWFDKLQSVIQSQQEPENEPCEEQGNTLEEWMILVDLHTPFGNSEQIPQLTHDWHQDRPLYSEQQIHEMPTWIKNKKDDYVNNEIMCKMMNTLCLAKLLLAGWISVANKQLDFMKKS